MFSFTSFSVVLFLFSSTCNCINILVYSPAFAASHTNFMARLADTLTVAGHNVTFLVPIVDVARRNQLGVQVTSDVVIVEQDEWTSRMSVPFDESMESYWTEHIDSSNVEQTFQWFFDGMALGCENFLRQTKVMEEMKTRQFDVVIVEPLSICGLGFANKLGIEKTILASSCAYYDHLFKYIGEPDHYSYLPSIVGTTGDKMDFWERYENYQIAKGMSQGITNLFNMEQNSIREHLGEDVPDWRELLPSASLFFTNSNPYLDFPRPVIQKTVPIGGISVNMEKIKSQKLDEKWDEILNKRDFNMLISFGSMVQSAHMLEDARNNLLEVIKSEPNVTFIWKYETNETSFANGVDNIHFSKWVPQTALLNDDRLTAFLNHGGLGSTNELAYCGKPAVVVPIFGDQFRNAQMLARHGGATVVQKTSLGDKKILKQAIHSVLYDGKFTENAKKLANLLENQPRKPEDQVVKYTEFVARFGPFSHMDPHGRKLNFIQRHLLDVYFVEFALHLIVSFVIFYFIPLKVFSFLKLFRIRFIKK